MWPVGHLLRWHLLAKEYVPGERSLSAEVGTSQLTEGSLRVRGAGGRPLRGWGVGATPAPCSSSSLGPFPPAGGQVSTPAWVIQSRPPAGCDPGPVG